MSEGREERYLLAVLVALLLATALGVLFVREAGRPRTKVEATR